MQQNESLADGCRLLYTKLLSLQPVISEGSIADWPALHLVAFIGFANQVIGAAHTSHVKKQARAPATSPNQSAYNVMTVSPERQCHYSGVT